MQHKHHEIHNSKWTDDIHLKIHAQKHTYIHLLELVRACVYVAA